MANRDNEAQESSLDFHCEELIYKTLDSDLAPEQSPPPPLSDDDSVVPSITVVFSPKQLDYLYCSEIDGDRSGENEPLVEILGNGFSSSDQADIEKPVVEFSLSDQEIYHSGVGAGLTNVGNSCFLNAVMQCFTHTVPLVEGLRSCSHPQPCQQAFQGFCVLCNLRVHVQNSLSRSGSSMSAMQFFRNLDHFSSSFTQYAQEDAHEFLQCFLDKLEKSLSDPITQSPEGPNLVERVFGASLVSKLQCCNCGHFSETFEPLTDLSLEIEGVESLPTALSSFTKVEKMEDSETKFQCVNCMEDVVMSKQLMINKAPTIAVFHLKRFKADGLGVEKIDKHVKFPLELDLQPYTINASGCNVDDLKYDLYGIVVHNGFSHNSGHYYSFIRSSSVTWHKLDDERVTKVSAELVLAQDAYILFYAKRGISWFSSLMGPNVPPRPESRTPSPTSVLDKITNASPVSVDNDASTRPGASLCLKGIGCSNVGGCTVIPLAESDNLQEVETVLTDNIFHPLTPPRPQTPEDPDLESPGLEYKIPRRHLKSEERTYRRRWMNKSPDDSENREAVRYLSRSMPSSRGSKLMEAIYGPPSDGARKKKRKLDSCNRSGPTNDHHKSRHSSVTQPVAVLR